MSPRVCSGDHTRPLISFCLLLPPFPSYLTSSPSCTSGAPCLGWLGICPLWDPCNFLMGPEGKKSLYIYGVGNLGSIVGGSGDPCLRYSCFMWMYLDCSYGLTCPPSLWQYLFPWLSSASGDLSSWFPPWWLPPLSLHFYFSMFFCLSSSLTLHRYNALSAACWGYFLIIIAIVIYTH